MENLTRTIWITALAAGVLALTGCGSKSGGTLAQVNGDQIGMDQFHDFMTVKTTARVMLNGEAVELPLAESPGYQSLQDMLLRQIVLQMAKDAGVAPTEADIEAEITFRKKVNSTFMRELNARGMTVAQIRESIKSELARERLTTRGVNVTLEDVETYIKDNPQQFTEPARVDLLWMLIRDGNKKDKAEAELQAGQSFSAVATAYSDYVPGQGGQKERYPVGIVRQMPKELQAIVTASKEGQTSDWIKTGQGFAKFLVERKYPERPQTLDATQKEVVRRNLALARGNASSDINRRIAEKLKDAKITVEFEPLKEPWKESEKKFRAEYDKQQESTRTEATPPKPATGAASGGSTGAAPGVSTGSTGQ